MRPVGGGSSIDLAAGGAPIRNLLEAAPSDTARVALVGLCIVGLLLASMVGGRLVIGDRSLLAGAVCSAAVLAGALGYLQLKLTPRALPLDWLRVLHEGNGSILLETAYGAPRAGPAFRALVDTYTPSGSLAIRGAAHLNLCLTATCACVFFCVAQYVLRAALPALAFVAAYLTNVQTLSVATSELPTVALELSFLLGVIGFQAVRLEPKLGRLWGTLGQAVLAITCGVAFLCRPESLLIGGPALLLSGLQRSRPSRVDALQSHIEAGVDRVIAAPPYLLILAGASSFVLKGVLSGKPVWIAQALNPFDPSPVMYPVLLASWVPLGVVALFVLGWFYCCRSTARVALLPLSLIVLVKLYDSAAHRVTFEALRYTSGLATAMFWIALFGWRQLEALASRWEWPRTWRAPALISLCAISLISPARVDDILRTPINRDHQRAGQALVKTIEAHPECILVTKHVERDGTHGSYAIFGRRQPVLVPAEVGLDEALRSVGAGSECAIFYYGLDCNRTDFPCAKEAAAYPEIWSTSWRSEPYSDRREYGEHAGELKFATFAIRMPKRAP